MFRSIMTITCTSFTGAVVISELFRKFGSFDFGKLNFLIPLFLICLSIALLMECYEKITYKFSEKKDIPLPADAAIRLLICYLTVSAGGVLAGWFSLQWKMLLYVSPFVLPVFIITYFVTYRICSGFADDINKAIELRGKEKNDIT